MQQTWELTLWKQCQQQMTPITRTEESPSAKYGQDSACAHVPVLAAFLYIYMKELYIVKQKELVIQRYVHVQEQAHTTILFLERNQAILQISTFCTDQLAQVFLTGPYIAVYIS